MSIISDALKKAQDKRNPQPKPVRVPAPLLGLVYPELLPVKPKEKLHAKTIKVLLSAILSSLVLAFSSLFLLHIYTPSEKNIHLPPNEDDSQTQPTHVPMPAAEYISGNISDPSTETPILNGIMYSTEDAKAILDGKIARRGDKVNSYTVVEISSDKVVLASEDGKRIDLNL
jgi:hypothetical protein